MVDQIAVRKVFSRPTRGLESFADSSDTPWNLPTTFQPNRTAELPQKCQILVTLRFSDGSRNFRQLLSVSGNFSFCIPVSGEIVHLDENGPAVQTHPSSRKCEGRSTTSGSRRLRCRTRLSSTRRRALTSPCTVALSWIKEPSSIQVPSATGMPPWRRLAWSSPFGPSARSLSLCMKADMRSPRTTSRWSTAATMNKKAYIEDFCGVGEDRSSWSMSGSRWQRTRRRHLATSSNSKAFCCVSPVPENLSVSH